MVHSHDGMDLIIFRDNISKSSWDGTFIELISPMKSLTASSRINCTKRCYQL